MQKWCKKGVVKGLRERERLKIRGSRNTLAKVYHPKSCWLDKITANFLFLLTDPVSVYRINPNLCIKKVFCCALYFFDKLALSFRDALELFCISSIWSLAFFLMSL